MITVQDDYLVQAELTRAAFEHSPDAVIVADVAGAIRLVNIQAELLTGRPRAELHGALIESLIPEDLRELHREHRQGFARNPRKRLMGPALDLSILQRTAGGDVPVPVEVNLSPAMTSVGLVVVATIRVRGDRWGSHG